ncbi:MAG: NAD-dependent epimerase/dehydratase family protein, partial [Gemmataceae bacterium]
MPKLIVGCGYLGTRVARLWLDAGEQVYALTRSRTDELKKLGIEPIVCDVTDRDSVRGGLAALNLDKKWSLVYCVALDRSSGRSMREVYVDGLRNFLAVCPETNRLIYVSSTSVYGQVDSEEVDE